MSLLNSIRRSAGILLHPTSLPSGKLDDAVFRWLDWLATAEVGVWQMLPLGVPLVELSPYQCSSAFAINPALFPADLSLTESPAIPFESWYNDQQHWVDDFALFSLLKQQFDGQEWVNWADPFKYRDAVALNHVRREYAQPLHRIVYQQYLFFCHWQTIRAYAKQKGIALFGDMPIFVAYDSADVWAHPERFLLDETGVPTFVTGVPPDYFSATGQRWGNPHYDWEFMQAEHFLWWKQRLAYHFEFFDLVRIDHFRGLAASWMIPATEETAINGYWQTVSGDAMLASIQATMGHLPLIAEDLGSITPDVTALRDKYQLPGMSVLQFGFDHFEDNPHKPHNVRENTVYYTGTHDNDTLVGWFNALDSDMQYHVKQCLKCGDTVEQVSDAMITTVLASRAQLAIIPLQDILYLDSTARMNIPGQAAGNWTWQCTWSHIPETLALELHNKLQEHQRNERELESVTTRNTSRSV